MAEEYRWTFKARFRAGIYGWKGTALASKRMKEGVSEIKKVARADSALAGEGTVELLYRLYPAVMYIDSSLGALGTVLNNTVEALILILIAAEWDMNTRGRWLEKLYEAICEDGWSVLAQIEDNWGDICVYPGLAHLWADRLFPFVKDVWSSDRTGSVTGDSICLSCLLYTERYDELYELTSLDRVKFWSSAKFWARALAKQGKMDEAVEYAESVRKSHGGKYDNYAIDEFCETVLIDAGREDEAYAKYGLNFPNCGTNLSIYRSILKKYPNHDKRQILLDLIEKTGSKSKWFAAAKSVGFLDIALDCARTGQAEPSTLLRTAKAFADKEPQFAVAVGVEAVMTLLTGSFYDPPTGSDVISFYDVLMGVARSNDMEGLTKRELSKAVLKRGRFCEPSLRQVLVRKLHPD